MSVPSSPKSQRRRRSSQFSAGPLTPVRSHSRQSSTQNSPTLRRSSRSFGIDGDNAGGRVDGLGLGSLADELADAWGDEDDIDGEALSRHGSTTSELLVENGESNAVRPVTPGRRSSLALSSPTQPHQPRAPEDIEKRTPTSARRSQHTRQKSSLDNSSGRDKPEYSGPEDFPTSLKARMADIEGLSKQGSESQPNDRAVAELLEQLQDLGAQSRVEGAISKLMHMHTMQTTTISQQTRALQSLSYAISPIAQPLMHHDIEALLPLVVSSLELIPQPALHALTSLGQVSAASEDVITALNTLSDSLHMSRQITTSATRKLKSTRELVADMRKEEEARDEGMAWIEKGRWQQRLQERDCARVCHDVVGGFELVCQGWRDKLVASAQVGA